jgi:RNA polymerase sigma factor (sigma-70 family)
MTAACQPLPIPAASAGDNIKLAFHVANLYSTRARALGLCREDLQQEAVVALLRASRHFDPTVGTKFSSYACIVIRNHLQNVLAKRRALPASGLPSDPEAAAREPEDRRAPAPDAAAVLADEQAYVARLVRLLPPRERLAVSLRFGLGDGSWRTLEDVAGLLRVSGERARQLVEAGLARMRRTAGGEGTDSACRTVPRRMAG